MVSSTGVGGLTLGGGIGWLMRKHGLASDNLVTADIVLPSGETVLANASKSPELFELLRGAGAGLGVVTRFEFRLHPVARVLGGGLWCGAERAADVLRAFRSFADTAPDELTMVASGVVAPPAPFIPAAWHGRTMLVIGCCWCGDLKAGIAALAPLRAAILPDVDLVAPMLYPAFQSSLDPTAPDGLRNYWRSSMLPELAEGMIDSFAKQLLQLPTPLSMLHLHQLQGAVGRSGDEANATQSLRASAFVLNVVATWEAPQHDAPLIDWARRCSEEISGTLRAPYVNFAGADESSPRDPLPPAIRRRVQAFKRRHDPQELFV